MPDLLIDDTPKRQHLLGRGTNGGRLHSVSGKLRNLRKSRCDFFGVPLVFRTLLRGSGGRLRP